LGAEHEIQVGFLLQVSVGGSRSGCALSAAGATSSGRCWLTGPPPGAARQCWPCSSC